MVRERHRHRYEVNNALLPVLQEHGLIASGWSPDGALVEIVELRDHPWMVGAQFHPEFTLAPEPAAAALPRLRRRRADARSRAHREQPSTSGGFRRVTIRLLHTLALFWMMAGIGARHRPDLEGLGDG